MELKSGLMNLQHRFNLSVESGGPWRLQAEGLDVRVSSSLFVERYESERRTVFF